MAPRIVTDAQKVLDVFQAGLSRGATRATHDPAKRYFYVEHPTEGWRVYLRSVCFIHELAKGFNPEHFIVVKRTGGDAENAVWEPPKGQMEGKEGLGEDGKSVYDLLRSNVRREVGEEAKLYTLRDVQHTGQVLQSVEPDYPPNTFFQYHIFSAYAYPAHVRKAFEEFAWIKEHPKAFARMSRDRREKDDIAWYDESTKKMMGKWSPTLVEQYLSSFRRSG